MSRPKDFHKKKVEVSRPATPLQTNPFALLNEVEALKNLAPPPPPPQAAKSAPASTPKPKADPNAPKKYSGRVVLRRETKHRGGKAVVIVGGLAELPGSSAVFVANLAKELKGKLGCGGSFDRQEIVLQGDRAAAVCALLEELGFTVAGVRE